MDDKNSKHRARREPPKATKKAANSRLAKKRASASPRTRSVDSRRVAAKDRAAKTTRSASAPKPPSVEPATPLPATAELEQATPPSERIFPIVGIGASAGGLEALELFLQRVPEKSGAAYVVVQHLDPD